MPRKPRASVGGLIYHVLNRSHSRRRIFYGDKDYLAFFEALSQALRRWPQVQMLSLCIMPNHWHLVLRPARDGDLSAFMRWLTQTHTQRWSSAWIRMHPQDDMAGLLCEWPVKRPSNWLSLLNEDQPDGDERRILASLERNRPLGDVRWTARMVKRLGLGHTMRPPGRPRNKPDEQERE